MELLGALFGAGISMVKSFLSTITPYIVKGALNLFSWVLSNLNNLFANALPKLIQYVASFITDRRSHNVLKQMTGGKPAQLGHQSHIHHTRPVQKRETTVATYVYNKETKQYELEEVRDV